MAAQGFAPPVQRARSTPAGEMRFRNIFSEDARWPEGRIIVIEHQTPEILWRPELLEHPNGASALRQCLFVSDRPDGTLGPFGRPSARTRQAMPCCLPTGLCNHVPRRGRAAPALHGRACHRLRRPRPRHPPDRRQWRPCRRRATASAGPLSAGRTTTAPSWCWSRISVARSRPKEESKGVFLERRPTEDAARARKPSSVQTNGLTERQTLDLILGKVCYNDDREAASGAAFPLFCAGNAMAGAEKSPGGNGRETCVRRLARAIRCANRAGADTRAGGRRRARTITRAENGSRRLEAPGRRRRGRNGVERNATEKRYAGTERQNFTEDTWRGEHDMARGHDTWRGPHGGKT